MMDNDKDWFKPVGLQVFPIEEIYKIREKELLHRCKQLEDIIGYVCDIGKISRREKEQITRMIEMTRPSHKGKEQ